MGVTLHWGEIGPSGDGSWDWTILAHDGTASWEVDGGAEPSEEAVKRAVEAWTPAA